MAVHKDFPSDPHVILDPAIRWFPADEAVRATSMEKLLPPLVPELRRSLLNWWFQVQHLHPSPFGRGTDGLA